MYLQRFKNYYYFLNKNFNKQFWAWILTFVLNDICPPKGVNASMSGLPQQGQLYDVKIFF